MRIGISSASVAFLPEGEHACAAEAAGAGSRWTFDPGRLDEAFGRLHGDIIARLA